MSISSVKVQSCIALFVCVVLFQTVALSQGLPPEITREEALAPLQTNRDRLLDSYALQNGFSDRLDAWYSFSSSQKGVFLTITDLLGRRTFMTPQYSVIHNFIYGGNEDDRGFGCAQMNDGMPDCNEGCYVHPPNYYGPACFFVSGQSCYDMGKCSDSPTVIPRTNHDMALNHVNKIYAINGSNGSNCGGINNNRLYFQADNELIYAIRNTAHPFPQLPFSDWRTSTDIAGPHSPFTQSKETNSSYPRGQTHEWAWDYEATYLSRPGVYGIFDSHIVEIDIDYEFWGHPSNPECYYDNTYGRVFYQNYWSSRGLIGSAELDYTPAGKF